MPLPHVLESRFQVLGFLTISYIYLLCQGIVQGKGLRKRHISHWRSLYTLKYKLNTYLITGKKKGIYSFHETNLRKDRFFFFYIQQQKFDNVF